MSSPLNDAIDKLSEREFSGNRNFTSLQILVIVVRTKRKNNPTFVRLRKTTLGLTKGLNALPRDKVPSEESATLEGTDRDQILTKATQEQKRKTHD